MKTVHYYLISLGVLLLLSVVIGTVWDNAVSPALRSLPRHVQISVTQKRTMLPNTPPQKNAFIPFDNNIKDESQAQSHQTAYPQTGEQALIDDINTRIMPAAAPNGILPQPQENAPNPYASAVAQNTNEAPSAVMQKDNGTMALDKPNNGVTVLSCGEYPASGKTEDLYKSSLPAVKAILAAQKEYFANNRTYAYTPYELNLELKDSGMPIKTKSRTSLQCKNGFTFVMGAGFLGVIYNSAALPMKQLYNIDFFYNGNATCYARTVEAGQACRALGGDFPRANRVLPNIIEYYLPKDFLDKN